MRLVHSLMSAYHIPLREAVSMTLPQIIMLNHASWCESKDTESRMKESKEREDKDPVLPEMGGKRMSEVMNNDALLGSYLGDWKGFG